MSGQGQTGIRYEPASSDRWSDIATIFEDVGAARKCWCAYWYLPNKDFRAGGDGANRAFLEQRVADGHEPGLIAYVEGQPAAWMSVAPRRVFDRLSRSRIFAEIDGRDVWSINCFVVKKAFRRKGLMRGLIASGIEFVRARGGECIEAYPYDGGAGASPSYELYVGTAAAFAANGFREVERRSAKRPMMRLELS